MRTWKCDSFSIAPCDSFVTCRLPHPNALNWKRHKSAQSTGQPRDVQPPVYQCSICLCVRALSLHAHSHSPSPKCMGGTADMAPHAAPRTNAPPCAAGRGQFAAEPPAISGRGRKNSAADQPHRWRASGRNRVHEGRAAAALPHTGSNLSLRCAFSEPRRSEPSRCRFAAPIAAIGIRTIDWLRCAPAASTLVGRLADI